MAAYQGRNDIKTADYSTGEKDSSPYALIIKVNNGQMECYYGAGEQADVELQISTEVMNEIVQGRMTFQRAFMAGSMKMKGDFRVLRTLDIIYNFSNQ